MQAAVVYVGEKLKRLRTLNALTQAELADRAELTTAAVARIERDEAEPRPSTLRKLAEALDETTGADRVRDWCGGHPTTVPRPDGGRRGGFEDVGHVASRYEFKSP